MTQTTTDTAAAPVAGKTTLATRGVSRKLLARKAAAKPTADGTGGEALEDAFPNVGVPDGVAEGAGRAVAESDSDNADASPQPDATPEPEHSGPDHTAAEAIADPGAGTEPSSAAPADASVIAPPELESGLSDAAPAAPAPVPAPAPAWSEADESALNALLARRKAAGRQRRGRDVSGQLIRLGDVKPNPDTVVAVIVGLVTEAGGSLPRGDLLDAMATAKFPKALAGDRAWCQGYVAGAIRCGFLAVGEAGEDLVSPRSAETGGGGLANARSAGVGGEQAEALATAGGAL